MFISPLLFRKRALFATFIQIRPFPSKFGPLGFSETDFPPFVPKASTFRPGTPVGPPGSVQAHPKCPQPHERRGLRGWPSPEIASSRVHTSYLHTSFFHTSSIHTSSIHRDVPPRGLPFPPCARETPLHGPRTVKHPALPANDSGPSQRSPAPGASPVYFWP